MKKNILRGFIALALLVLVFTLSGCGESPEVKNGKIEDISKWVKEVVKPNVTEDVDLPTTHPELGGTITWLSNDSEVIDETGTIYERGRGKVIDVEMGYYIEYNGDTVADTIVLHVCPITLEEASDKFETTLQRRVINDEKLYFVQRDIVVEGYYGIISVEITSSDNSVLTSDGKYIKPLVDTPIVLTVVVSDSYRSITKEYNMNVQGRTSLEVVEDGLAWLDANFVDMMLTAETGLPTVCGDIGATITWKSSNDSIVSNDGKVTEYVYERYVSLEAKVEFNGASQTKAYYCKVKALDTTNMTEQEILENYISSLTRPTLPKMNFTGYGDITQSYGFLYLYDGQGPDITRAIIKDGLGNKPDQDRVSTEFVCVHDTGNPSSGANAEMHSRYINNGSAGAQTSWHFSVDDVSIYQQIEDTEIAWHAGDGSRLYKLRDSGVKANLGMPLMTFSEDGYFVLGGQKTQIQVPSGTKNMRTCPYGIYTEVGPNGNWWINDCHYDSTYGAIGNNGGNRNSVSMETCVHPGSDYTKTFINAAKLSTYIAIKYDLSVDRILQHNSFSGKNCPQAIRQSGYWANFKDLCASIKFGLENYKEEYEFKWTPENSAKITETGLIAKSCAKGEVLNYSLKVNKNHIEIFSKDFSVTLA